MQTLRGPRARRPPRRRRPRAAACARAVTPPPDALGSGAPVVEGRVVSPQPRGGLVKAGAPAPGRALRLAAARIVSPGSPASHRPNARASCRVCQAVMTHRPAYWARGGVGRSVRSPAAPTFRAGLSKALARATPARASGRLFLESTNAARAASLLPPPRGPSRRRRRRPCLGRPEATRPSAGPFFTVQMKNCDPFVPGPAFAMDRAPAGARVLELTKFSSAELLSEQGLAARAVARVKSPALVDTVHVDDVEACNS